MVTEGLARNLNYAIINQDDPATVKAGAPAYMLMLDGLIHGDPENQGLLIAGARLYGTYATVFVADNKRARRLSGKAMDYARRAMCQRKSELCTKSHQPYDEFVAIINTLGKDDVPVLFTYAATWAGWIITNSGEWDAIADVPRVEAMMKKIVALDETYERGQAHLYLGVMQTQLPAALGGHPEQGRAHFERAIKLSGGRNLIAKVELARRYARMMFNHTLHDRLLNEVLQAETDEPGLTLSNTLAKQQARQLLSTSKDYFLE